ncbi:isoprenoid synthase domain-containing protein [Irpex rosettiformis]|uniref:Isoprenoid synthase domain-containing protein n=1 Tax=Irpex rosettiformis TaxID=378272 RepID=A0ACB8U8H1_9APHY|nr:isoprenoid synthase domain-containing protein [Irpex rosettiformis]
MHAESTPASTAALKAKTIASDEIVKISRTSVAELLQRTKIPLQSPIPVAQEEVERKTREGAKEWTKKGLDPARYARHFRTSVNIATYTYSHTPVEVQIFISLFTLLALCVDDLEVDSDALDSFGARLYTGKPQLDPALDCLVDVLGKTHDYYPPYAAKSIIVATIEFVDATLFDKESVGVQLHQAALPYVEYKRLRNSLGGAYGAFVWDKFSFPDIFSHIQPPLPGKLIMTLYTCRETFIWLNYSNDVLSFYKEELAGEKDNYVHDRALVTNKSISTVLTELVNELVESIERARSILKGEKEKEAWERLLAGYVAYHYTTPRYKLVELLEGEI